MKICASFWILATVSCFSLKQDSFSHTKRETQRDFHQVCPEKRCGNITYSDILKQYPGVFFTRSQYALTRSKFKAVREDYLRDQKVVISEGRGDGDSCCPTDIKTFINYTMTNIYGEEKYIMHMPPKYQFVPHGYCLATTTNKCKGICAIEPIILHLLTYNSSEEKLEFDQFIIPGYCSCKAVHSAV